jgi:hypothetical protein
MAWRARIRINSTPATAEFQKILDHNPLERRTRDDEKWPTPD